MAWLIVLILLIFVFRRVYKRNKDVKNKGFLLIYYLALFILINSIFLLIFVALSPKETTQETDYLTPVALKHRDHLPSQEFYVGTDSKNELGQSKSYFYSYVDKSNYTQMVEIPKDKTDINISDKYKPIFFRPNTKNNPHIVTKSLIIKHTFTTKYILLTDYLNLGDTHYTFYLPPDTIYYSFNITRN